MSLETDLQESIQQEQPPAAQEQQPPVDEEAQLDAELEQQAIEVPDGDKLVPLSAVTTVRAKYKTAKQEASEAKQKAEQAVDEVARMRQALEEAKPWIEAAKSLAAARQMGPDQPHQAQLPSAEETAELEAIAKDYDFYQGDGTPDLARARRTLDRERTIAERAAQQAMAPHVQQSVQERSQAMLSRALRTTTGPGGKPIDVDPNVLKEIWGRLDPSLTATKEGAQWALLTAVGASVMTGKQATPQPTQQRTETPPPPLFTEKAGGRDTPANIVLNDGDKRVAKDMGLSEKEYAEQVAKMPWRR